MSTDTLSEAGLEAASKAVERKLYPNSTDESGECREMAEAAIRAYLAATQAAPVVETELAETVHGEIVRVAKRDNPMREPSKCSHCNDTGMIAIRSRDGAYAFPGPVPDDAKGYADADCWHCDSGRRGGFDGPTGAE